MNRPRALLFDLGGVVLDHDFGRAFESWQACSRIDAAEMARRFSHDEPYSRHERGELHADDYFRHLAEVLEIDAPVERIAQGWNSTFIGLLETTLARVHRARTRLPTYAFSNTNHSHQAVWSERFPTMVSAFEHVFTSNELGMRKPEREAFHHVSASMGFEPDEVLFFDDLEENVIGARAAGLQAVLVRGDEDVRAALEPLGID